MKIEERKYQQEAISQGTSTDNGLLVLPTGSGKSVVCAGITSQLDGGTIVLQPSVEILASNLAKARLYGIDAEVYSASAGQKTIGKVTYATIGSIINKLDQFRHVRNIVVDEAHLVNPKGGMYEHLISTMQPDVLVGMTATPYRLSTSSFGSCMKILNRTRPKIFEDIAYVANPRELVEQGFLMMPEFRDLESDTSMLRPNTTGADFSEASTAAFAYRNNIKDVAVQLVRSIGYEHILIFAQSVEDSIYIATALNKSGVRASEINALTPKKTRAKDLELYQQGNIRVMVNVGTLTTGYDFPALNCIIDARPTMSAALHYQKIGRVVRPFPGKEPVVYDLCGNVERLGNPLNYTMIKNSGGNYEVYSERGRITTRIITPEPECKTSLAFGKHKGKRLADIDSQYLEWAVNELKGENKHIVFSEIKRRELFGVAA